MHPWMDPDHELKLWPHDYNPIYEVYNRIFDCRGQGWANLQWAHLNLPFASDDQFGRLHAAIRILLPLLPALAASSPVVAGALTGYADNRMRFYRHNSQRVPSLTGQVVPEVVFNCADYEQHIFQVMYRDIAPFDTDKILCHEWLNSRGAIARFDRHAIEIRVLDVQDVPAVDIAICEVIVAVFEICCVGDAGHPLPNSNRSRPSRFHNCWARPFAKRSGQRWNRHLSFASSGWSTPSKPRNRSGRYSSIKWQIRLPSIQPLRTILEYGPLARCIERALLATPIIDAAETAQTVAPLRVATSAENSAGDQLKSIPHERLLEVYQQYCLTE